MPGQQVTGERRGRPLLSFLFWLGVGLAPVAVLLLLVSDGNGPMRIAAVLAVLAVVLIGLSITLRGGAETMRADVEETLLEEIDRLRNELRNDIGTAARTTHKAVGEHLQRLQGNVATLYAQLESARADLARGVPARVDPPAITHGQDPSGFDRAGFGRAGYDPGDGAGGRQHPPLPGPPAGLAPQVNQPAGQRAAGGAIGPHVGGRASVASVGPMPPGVVRHTETVQVTTRHTIVDPHPDASGAGSAYAGGVYGSRAGGADGEWTGQSGRGRLSTERDDDSWTEQWLRERGGGDIRRAWPGDVDAPDVDPGQDERWSGMRAGDRWASVRSDERGRELRVGERRAAVRADETGTEMRVEDRWASVRREEPSRAGYWSGESGWRDEGERRRTDDSGSGRDRDDRGWDDRGWEQRPAMAALPAGSTEPASSWDQGWSEPEREPARRGGRYRDDGQEFGYPPDGDVPRAGAARRLDFEPSDERWR